MEWRGQWTPPPRQLDDVSRLLVLVEEGVWIEGTREQGQPCLELLEGVRIK